MIPWDYMPPAKLPIKIPIDAKGGDFMTFIKTLKTLKEVIEIIIPFLAWWKKRKVEKALNAAIQGVEAYSKQKGDVYHKLGLTVKELIKSQAIHNQIEDFLYEKVQEITKSGNSAGAIK